MERLSRLLDADALTAREQEFYWLWIFATTAYGVGDILTTLTILSADTGVAEGNVVISYLFAVLGHPGFIALKLLVFFGALAVSVTAAEYWQDRHLYYGPPLILAVLGTLVTANNLHLVLQT